MPPVDTPFERLSLVYRDVPGVTQASMMGQPCLKVGRVLFASSQHGGDAVVLKLAPERVAALVADGTGAPFAPGGRAFAKWVQIEGVGWERLVSLADEAFEGARTGATA